MNDDPDDTLDDELRALPGAGAPPPELEERVIDALRSRDVLAARHRERLWLTAAGLAGAALGWLGRGASRVPANPDGSLYLLLLSPLPQPGDAATEALLIEEYGAWARSLGQGRVVRGEKLGSHTATVGSGAAIAASGFFLVRAAGHAEAQSIAAGCPHVRHGGTITVRNVDPT